MITVFLDIFEQKNIYFLCTYEVHFVQVLICTRIPNRKFCAIIFSGFLVSLGSCWIIKILAGQCKCQAICLECRTKSLPDKIPSAHFCIGGHNPSHVFCNVDIIPPTLFYKVDKIPSVNFPARTKPLSAEIPYDSPSRSESYLATCYLAIILFFSSNAGKDSNCTNNC